MYRVRFAAWILAALGLFLSAAREASAAAEVHRLNVVLSGMPTGIAAKDFNDFIDNINKTRLEPFGIEGIKKIHLAWLFQAEGRYFVTPDVAICAGFGQLRSQSKREILPGLQQDVQLRAEILSVPVHVGAAYYFAPYNQGDFRARAYVSGGFMSVVYNRGRFQQVAAGFDSSFGIASNIEVSGRGDAPGYFLETGAHLWFATRFSVLLGVVYRSAVVRGAEGRLVIGTTEFRTGRVFDIDTTGFGARMAMGIGL